MPKKEKTVAKSEAQAATRKDRPRLSDDPSVVRFQFIGIKVDESGRPYNEAGKLLEGGSGLGLDALARCTRQTLNMKNDDGFYSIVVYRLADAVA